jgi:hypothetical protein
MPGSVGPGVIRRPLCSENPTWWDLDSGTSEIWSRAVRICGTCPMLTSCDQSAHELTERGLGPRAAIWAGVGYDSAGRVIADLMHYSRPRIGATRRESRIMRIGAGVERVSRSSRAARDRDPSGRRAAAFPGLEGEC